MIIPENEAARLAALRRYGILDTPAEQEFDDFTALASQICRAPIALITLVDERRQWFKSKVGVEVSETPREVAFCAHTICGPGLMEVPDAREDARFRNNPLVTGAPDIRFYAGAPLTSHDGQKLGTLCVIDRMPRQLTAEQRVALERLSRAVVRQMELQLANRALQRSEDRCRDLVENATDLIQTVAPDGRITFVNRAWLEAFGYTEAEALGRNVFDLIHPSSRLACEEHFQRVLGGETIRRMQVVFLAKDGRSIHAEGNVNCRFEGGRPVSTRGIFHDVSERRRLEASLAEARDQALEASRLKSEFLSTISHEIRTPMNAIIGMSRILADSPLTPSQAEMAGIVVGAGEELLKIINDILDLSRIESGRLRLDATSFDLRRLVTETLALLVSQAKEKGVGLVSDVEAAPAAWLLGDSGRVRQVLVNLVGNALKFTLAGEVKVSVATVGETPERIRVRVTVADTGVGIPSEVQPQLFQPFVQAEGGTTRRFGGTGLGLAITKQLVDLMGGTIGFSSAPGQGSVFWFEVEFSRGEAPAPPPPRPKFARLPVAGVLADQELIRPLRLLLVEDSQPNQLVARIMFERMGHAVAIASSGPQALERLAAGQFHAVLMDCQMPGMDGYETTRRVRLGEGGANNTTIPIIALTAYARPEDRQRCLDAGMNDYVTKPLRAGEVSEAFVRCGLAGRGTLPATATVATAATAAPPPPSAAPPSAAAATPVNPRILDAATLETARALPGMRRRSLLPELLEAYYGEEASRLERIERLGRERRAEELGAEAHGFGGNAASFGGIEVRRLSLEIERVAGQADWTAVDQLLPDLRAACGRLRAEVDRLNLANS